MVFCGKPSKACTRCRARRLKCDLQTSQCGQCVRANVPCSGYRDTRQLRIRIESRSVARKALKDAAHYEPHSLPLSIDSQARDAFFAHYVTSKCWSFLRPYHHPIDSPKHLTLAIEAVSLAYLWHQVHSEVALANARKRYISALRMTNLNLQSSRDLSSNAILIVSLLLDLFEKVIGSKPHNRSWTAHVEGALALVKERGLARFQEQSELTILIRLSTHCIIGCIAGDSPIPDQIIAIQTYIGEHRSAQGPVLRLSNLMVDYANLRSSIASCVLSRDKCIEWLVNLDEDLKVLDLELPSCWQYSVINVAYKSDKILNPYYHCYSNPKICQARNMLRVMRILVNEYLVKFSSMPLNNKEYLPLVEAAHKNIEKLSREICATAPQYVDCDHAARPRVTTAAIGPGVGGTGHSHRLDHELDCCTLIFPLYVAGRCEVTPDMRCWVIETIHHVGYHFRIRDAVSVARILEQGLEVDPWEVYAMLGGYAFAT